MSTFLEKRRLIALIAGAIGSILFLLAGPLDIFDSLPDLLYKIIMGIWGISCVLAHLLSGFRKSLRIAITTFKKLNIIKHMGFTIISLPFLLFYGLLLLYLSIMVFGVCLFLPVIPTAVAYFMD